MMLRLQQRRGAEAEFKEDGDEIKELKTKEWKLECRKVKKEVK